MSETLQWALVDEMPAMNRFLVVFGMTLATIMAFLLGLFFMLHIYLMIKATTTIEFCEKRTKHRPGSATSPDYSRGLFENIRAVLGPYVLLWMLPICPPSGDGLSFNLKESSSSSTSNDADKDGETTALLADARREEQEPEQVASGTNTPKFTGDAQEEQPPEVTGEKAEKAAVI